MKQRGFAKRLQGTSPRDHAPPDQAMHIPRTPFDEDVTISVERMIRFCYLAKMQFEYASLTPTLMSLPLHLTRFGALLIETSSFLYSLFEDRQDSIDLLRIWRGFDHPFTNELLSYSTRLNPFKEELKLVRNRLGFHGSLTRSHERAGLGIFDVASSRARDFARLIREIQHLFERMIDWYVKKSAQAPEIWGEFMTEMRSYSIKRASV